MQLYSFYFYVYFCAYFCIFCLSWTRYRHSFFYNVPCIYFILFFCVLGLHNIDFICSTCIVSDQSALMHFNK